VAGGSSRFLAGGLWSPPPYPYPHPYQDATPLGHPCRFSHQYAEAHTHLSASCANTGSAYTDVGSGNIDAGSTYGDAGCGNAHTKGD